MRWIFVLIILGIIIFIGASFLIPPKTIEIIPPTKQASIDQVKIILVGDIMLDRGVANAVQKQGDGDFKFPFLKIADYFNKADIVFGNLEGVISDKGFKGGSIYSFRVRPEAIEGLKFSNFNVLSLANNHALDYTKQALEDCLTRLSNAQIKYVGAGLTEKEAYSPTIKEINNTKIGFLAYTDLGPEVWRATSQSSGIAWISEKDFEKVKNDIENAKSESDILIVSLHSGKEYTQELTSFQVNFSRMAIEAGANIIAGHHPHVVQKYEQYENNWIFYSLGNFIFDQSFSEETMTGQIVEVLIENKKIKEIIPKKIKINNFFQPEIQLEKL